MTGVCWSADGQHAYVLVGALDNEIHVRVSFGRPPLFFGTETLNGPCDRCTTCGKTGVYVHWTHRHPDFPRTLAQRCLLPLTLAFLQTITHDTRPPRPGSTTSCKVDLPGSKAGKSGFELCLHAWEAVIPQTLALHTTPGC